MVKIPRNKAYSWDVYYCDKCEYHFAILMRFSDDEEPDCCPTCTSKSHYFVDTMRNLDEGGR